MPLAAAYGLDEIYRKSLRWITRHFVRIWPCKAFATLPRELMEKCYLQHIVHMVCAKAQYYIYLVFVYMIIILFNITNRF